ncbi:MAG: hypothetical protein HC897_02325 [Thermoanaerobaculia bacterium]|nr:hypothetical protein [Thermoanaerobaculia bacterium]
MFKYIFVLICFLLVARGVFALAISKEIDAQHALVRPERNRSFSGAFRAVDVFSNNVKAGEIGNGQEKIFRLPLSEDNTYIIAARMVRAIGPAFDPLTKTIRAEPGTLLYAHWETNAWVMKAFPDFSFDVVIERTSATRIRYLPRFFGQAVTRATQGIDDRSVELPWGAIGAIASAIGAIAEIATLLK